MFGNACTWWANLANATCHNQIWYASYQLIARWCPYKEITWYKQHSMCAVPVHACSVFPDYYEFQSFTILCELDTLQSHLTIWNSPKYYIIISLSLSYLAIWNPPIYSYILQNHQVIPAKSISFCGCMFLSPKFWQLLF